jgi:hypothetical protein
MTKKVRYLGLVNNMAQGVIKYDEDDVSVLAVDLPDSVDKTDDAAVRTYAKDKIKANHSYDLVASEDIPTVRAKLDDWLSDQSTATSDEILIELVSLLRDKGAL